MQTLSAVAATVFAGLAFAQTVHADHPTGLAPVVPAVAAIVGASPRERAFATLRAIAPGIVQRRVDQERQWHVQTVLKLHEAGGQLDDAVGSVDPERSRGLDA